MSAYAGRRLVITGFAGLALCVLYVVACLVSLSVVGDAGWELAPGSSVFGQASRSWIPTGDELNP